MTEILKYLIGGFVAIILFWFFMKGRDISEPIIVETVVTDTCWMESTEIVYLEIPEIEILYQRDTVLIGFAPKIKGYKALFPFLYGNVSVQGEVLGEVLKMSAETDFKFPQITNTITRDIYHPAPERIEIWGVGELGSSFELGLDVRKGKNRLGYKYDLLSKDPIKHRLSYGRLLFDFKSR